jgi:hypothetical protein
MKERGVVLSFEFPRDLIARAKKVNAIFHTKTTQLLRDGLRQKVEELEDKHRRETALQIADEAAKKAKDDYRKTLRAAGSTISPLAPLSTQVRMSSISSGPTQDPMEALYTELARSIRDAGDDTEEKRKRIDAAVAAVNRERPLTAPSTEIILRTLETYILKLRDEPVTSTYDSLVNTILDVSKLKTSGVTE